MPRKIRQTFFLRFFSRSRLLPVLFFLLTASLSGAQDPPPKQSDEVIRLSTELVVLDAEVLSQRTGQPISSLKPSDFTLYEDGIQQEITYFSYDRLPLSIVLLLDVSSSVWSGLDQIQAAALHALLRLKPEDEVALMVFASKTTLVQDFTQDRRLMAHHIETIKKLRDYGTDVNRAVYDAAAHLKRATKPSRRRVVIAITDNESAPAPEAAEKETMDELFESGSVVCGLIVGPFDELLPKPLKSDPPVVISHQTMNGQLGFGKDYLNPQADATGGLVVAAKKKEITDKFTAIIEHLRTRYSLGYMPSNAARTGEFRKIRLSLAPDIEKREGRVTIITKQGYYARKPESKQD